MMKKLMGIVRQGIVLLPMFMLVASAFLTGCSSDGYDTPVTTSSPPVAGAATSVVVEPTTLTAWIDQGLVNSAGHFDQRVVILDFGSYKMDPAVDPMRIRGACRVAKADLEALRFEGVANANPMVAPGEKMDAVIQRLGINEDTTIVFTTTQSAYYATRAYWTFRYWGFPKERLKILNGGCSGTSPFATAYPDRMTREVPAPVPSTYSVRDLPGLNADLRASVGEMIDIIDGLPTDTANLVIDARGSKNFSGQGSTGGLVGGDFVVVDGHPKGGQFLSQADLYAADGKFKSREEIEALFAAKGWAPGKKVTVYCTSGYSATPLFFALGSILDTPVQLFDGSWSQLGKYSDFAAGGGQLAAGSSWAIDKHLAFTEGYRYNVDYLTTVTTPVAIETLKLDSGAIAAQPSPFTGNVPTDASDVVPSQIEAADAAYVGTGTPIVFPAPAATATAGVLIDVPTLQGWVDAGLVNAPLGQERVVILDATDELSFFRDKKHIPGAHLWDITQHTETRVEGPAPAVNMVVTGARMDQLIQAAGIDQHTTVVITSSQGDTFYPSRAYLLFRYYGFPKERLKVLNGYNGAWTGSGNTLTGVATAAAPSTLSVSAIANHRPDLRASSAELMDAIRDGRGTPVDFRGVKTAAKSTAGVFADVAGDFVVFEGQLNGGLGYVWKNFNINYDGVDITGDGVADPKDLTFKSAAEIQAALNAIGLDGSQSIYSYCRTGYIASAGFFVLDALLDWPVMVYDGSWSQLGKYSSDSTKKGELPSGSTWAVDNATYMSVITYNADAAPTTRMQVIEPLNADSSALLLKPADAAANQIENADAEYQVQASGNEAPVGPPTAGGGTSGGGC
jgi:3-mercaptopyruvate sulfurtransferase SseA